MKRFITSIASLTIALVIGFFHAATPTFLKVEGQVAHHEASSNHHQPSIANGCQTICQGSPVRDVDGPEEELQEDDSRPTPQPTPFYATTLHEFRFARQYISQIWKNTSWTPPDILLLTGIVTTGR